MQDFRSIAEFNGRIFAGAVADWGSSAENRRLKAYPSAMAGPSRPLHQVKCPRCESLNTKFCYYNNYNLSQPRHFCKTCRRYWTRGGVLRNVPVGGGCRKPKRSSSKSSSESSSTDKDCRRRNSGSRSSSDSSGITPATTSSIADGSASFPDSTILFNCSPSIPNPSNPCQRSFAQSVQPDIPPFAEGPAEFFSNTTAGFSSLMAGAADDHSILKLNFLHPPLFRHPDPPHRNLDEIHKEEFIYQTASGEPAAVRETGSTIHWPPGMDPGIYELSGAAGPATYWTHNHWSDGDPSLYLP